MHNRRFHLVDEIIAQMIIILPNMRLKQHHCKECVIDIMSKYILLPNNQYPSIVSIPIHVTAYS